MVSRERTYSAHDALELADQLVRFLKSRIRDTHHQGEWSQRNFALLREFAQQSEINAECYPSAKDVPPEQRAKQFLWDFIAYKPKTGIVLAVESEHGDDKNSVLEDFEKLLYVRSPVKLMMCRVGGEEGALKIKDWAQEFMEQTCTWYSPGEVFVLYCVWWSGLGQENRDFAYRLQIGGEFDYRGISTERFEAV